MRADARKRLSLKEQDIRHFKRASSALKGPEDLTAMGRCCEFFNSDWGEFR